MPAGPPAGSLVDDEIRGRLQREDAAGLHQLGVLLVEELEAAVEVRAVMGELAVLRDLVRAVAEAVDVHRDCEARAVQAVRLALHHARRELMDDEELLGQAVRADDRRDVPQDALMLAASTEPITVPGCAPGVCHSGSSARPTSGSRIQRSRCLTSSMKSAWPGWMSSSSSAFARRAARK